MHSVSIDPGVLAAPTLQAEVDEVYNYVHTLLDWQQLLEEPWVSIYLSERSSEVLVEEGLFPLRDALKNVFEAKGVVEFDVNTVALVAESLLQLTPSFEAYFRVKDVLVEELETHPSLISLTVGEKMAADLGRSVVLIALLREHCKSVGKNHNLILKSSPESGIISVSALIHDIEHERDDIEQWPVIPEVFEGSVIACHHFRGFIQCIDENTVWRTATDEIGKEVALRITVYKSRLARGLDPDWEDVPCFQFGGQFLEIADRVCAANMDELVSKLLRSMSETIESLNMVATHSLRKDRSGGAPQKQRKLDQARAWRRDIDNEYHLHYWECDSGVPEFASIGPHNDFSIPE